MVLSKSEAPSRLLFQWQIQGWDPFIISAVASYTPKLLRVSGEFKDNQIQLYIRKQDLPHDADPAAAVDRSLAHLRLVAPGKFALSLLTEGQQVIELLVCASSLEAGGNAAFLSATPAKRAAT